MELVRGFFPLHSLAKHACVAKIWKVKYEKRLDIEQQLLRAIVAAPAGASSSNLTETERALAWLKQALPVFDAWDGQWQEAASPSGPRPQRVREGLNGYLWFPQQPKHSSGLEFHIWWKPHTNDRRLIQLQSIVRDLESLHALMGLLLDLSPHLLPQVCTDDLMPPGFAGSYVTTVMECRVTFKTGWNMWAPLAPLIGELRFSPSRSRLCPSSPGWMHVDGAVSPVPTASKYVCLWKARCATARPLTMVHILAPRWEHSTHWPASKWVHPA